MRAGRLQTRRYKARKRRRWAALILLLMLGAGAAAALRSQAVSLPDWLILPSRRAQDVPMEGKTQSVEMTLPAGLWHVLRLGEFSDAAQAYQTAAAYQDRGAGGYVLSGENHQVLAAAYASRSDAQQVQSRLSLQYGIETEQTDVSWPEIRLRLTGREDQLTAVDSALSALLALPEQLYALSDSLDRQTADAPQVRAALLSYGDTLTALGNRLDAAFSAPPRTVSSLRAALSALSSALEDARSASGGARLGGQVKYCQLMALCLTRQLTETLSGGS